MTPLVLLAHPDLASSRVNRALYDAAGRRGGVTRRDLYAEYPAHRLDEPLNVAREQDLLAACDRVVLQFPLYWYSVPPLLKKWMDDVLTHGWAFGRDATGLRGEELMIAASIGGRQSAYRAGGPNLFPLDDLLRPLHATANICGMRFVPSYITEGAADDAELAAAAEAYADALFEPAPESYPAG